jgi:hypothetical protein
MRRKPVKPAGGPFQLDATEIQSHVAVFNGWNTNPANISVYDPEPKQIIAKSGAWIMITRQLPPIEGGLDKKVRVGRIFYAWHHEDADEKGFRPTGLYMVRMVAPSDGGESARELSLYPYEYSAMSIESILGMWAAGEIRFHPRNIDLAQMNSVVFYARSRGIPVVDAMVMALGTLNGDVGWFEPVEELAEEIEAMEERVNRWKPTRTLKEPMEIRIRAKQ